MPLKKIDLNEGNPWAIWEINEPEGYFLEAIQSYESVPVNITSEKKRLEWAAGRYLAKNLIEKVGYKFKGITKDQHGKPFPTDCPYQLSLSHSYPFVAAYIHKSSPIGIDLEQPKAKLLRIANRVLSRYEIEHVKDDLTRHCITWCAKEVLVKIHGKKDLVFAENLKIDPFSLSSSGYFIGSIIVNSHREEFPLYYEVFQDFALVLNKPI